MQCSPTDGNSNLIAIQRKGRRGGRHRVIDRMLEEGELPGTRQIRRNTQRKGELVQLQRCRCGAFFQRTPVGRHVDRLSGRDGPRKDIFDLR